MQIPDTDTPLILLALGVAMYHVPSPERVAMEELERRIQVLRGTDFEQIHKDLKMADPVTQGIVDAAHSLASQYGMRDRIYQFVNAYTDFFTNIKIKVGTVTQAATQAANAQARPSVLYRPTLSFFGAQNAAEKMKYCAVYGECMGVGATPAEAMENFDKKWSEK